MGKDSSGGSGGIISGFSSRFDQFKRRVSNEALSVTDRVATADGDGDRTTPNTTYYKSSQQYGTQASQRCTVIW